jgi:photosystem II stability/assembly factor-like uncharacterized protein
MANSTIIYAATGSGLAIFNKPGTLPEWLPPRPALQGEAVSAAWGAPGPPIKVVAATERGLLMSENGGRTWESVGPDTDGAHLSLLYYDEDDHTLYAARSDGSLLASMDDGSTWDDAGALPASGELLALARADLPGDYFVLVEGSGLYVGNPRHRTWQGITGADVHAFASLSGGSLLFVCTGSGVASSEGRGTPWRLLQGSPAGGTSIVSIPGSEPAKTALVVGTPDGMWTSPDAGITWQQPDLPAPGGITAIARDPERRDRLYAATGTGLLFESGNRGAEWQAVNDTPVAPVRSLYVVRI